MCGYGGVPLFRGALFLKRTELSASVFRTSAELWVPFEETCRIMGAISKNVAKFAEKGKGCPKRFLMILLRFEKIFAMWKCGYSLHYFAELWVAFFRYVQNYGP